MTDPLARARRDLAQLEDQIAVHSEAIQQHQAERERAVKAADEVRVFIRLFGLYSEDDARTIVETTAKTLSGFSIAERVTRLAEELIRSAGRRVPTETIYQHAMAAGIPIGGKDEAAKRNNLSGILSRDARFHGVRRRGWWLITLGRRAPDDPIHETDDENQIETAISSRRRALVYTLRFLRNESPQPTQYILRELLRRGIDISGDNQEQQVRELLSTDPIFTFLPEEGWTLTAHVSENTEAADTPGKDTSAASAEPRPTSEGIEAVRPVDPQSGGGT